MQVGSVVQYRSRLDDEPLAAIVTFVWTDGKYELRIFGRDHDFHVIAADPSQVTVVMPVFEIQDEPPPQTLSAIFAAEEAREEAKEEEAAVHVESTSKKKREAWPR